MASKRARVLAWSAAAAAAALLAAAAVLPLIVDVDRFRPTLEKRLGGALGAPVSLGRLRLTLWTGPGVTSDGVHVSAASPDGTVFDSPGLTVRLALLPLLHGTLEARNVALRAGVLSRGGKPTAHDLTVDARVSLVADGSATAASGRLGGVVDSLPGSPRGTVSFDGRLSGDRLTVDRLDIEAGRARIEGSASADGLRTGAPRGQVKARIRYLDTRAEGDVAFDVNSGITSLRFDLSAESVDFDALAALFSGEAETRAGGLFPAAEASASTRVSDGSGFLSRVRGTGRLSAARARWDGLEVQRFTSDVRLDAGTARLENAAFEAYGGRGAGSIDAHLLEPGVPFSVSSRLDGVRVQPVLAAFSRDLGSVVEGTGSVTADLEGIARAGVLARSLRGTAAVKVEKGKIRSIGLMKQVARLLEMAGGRGIGKDETPFERASADFAVRDGVARTNDLQFRSTDLDLDGSGSVTADGALAFDVVSTFSREASADLLRRTPQLRFRVGDDGRLSVPMQVRGSAKAPNVQLDLDRVLREGLQHELKNEGAKGLLKRLLGK